MEITGRVQQILVKDGKDHDATGTGEATATSEDNTDLGERFWIDEGSFPIYRDHDEDGEPTTEYRLTGKELREILEPPAEQIWQWVDDPFNAGQHKRELVEDGALISLQDGDKFTVVPEEAESSNGHVDEGEASESEPLDLNQPVPVGGGRRGRGAE